jgi:Xaa-Pro aminopeptidase
MNNADKIQAALKAAGLEAILITSPVNRLYATGFASSAGMALITADRAWFLTDSRYIEAAACQIRGFDIQLVAGKETYEKKINDIVNANGVGALGFEDESVTYSEYKQWSGVLNIRLEAAQSLLTRLRAVKSRADLEGMILAQRLAEKAFEQLLPLISTDVTEKELAAELIYRFLKLGAEGASFEPIVVSGVRSSMPHGVPTDAHISKGFLTIDFGVKKDGWCSDTTRTLCVGEPDAEMRRVYHTVLSAQTAGIEAARAGVPGSEIDGAARRVIAEAGYGGYFGHGFGHGLGLEVHEAPNAAPSNKNGIPEGAVISAEPGIYMPGRYGVRIEDVLYVTQNGSENLTNLPKALLVV